MSESGRVIEGKLVIERGLPGEPVRADAARRARPARSLSVNLAESPLGWLFARGHVNERQYLAGERLRWDWERAQLDPQVTMRWDAAPMRRGRGGRGTAVDPSTSQIDARRRFTAAVEASGRGWPTSCGGSSARARECARPRPRLAGQRVRESLCLASRLTASPTITVSAEP